MVTSNYQFNFMNQVCVALFNDRAAAYPIRQRLLQAGIPAEIHEELGLARLWFVSKRSAGVGVEVPGRQSGAVQELLRSWDISDGALCGAIHCPECQSLRVDYPQVTRKSFCTNLVFGFLAGIGLVEKDYYCENCHCMWPKPSAKPALASSSGLALGMMVLGVVIGLGGALPAFGDTGVQMMPTAAGVKADGKISVPAENQATTQLASPTYLRDVLPIMMGKCARCHGEETSVLHDWLDYKTAFNDRVEIKRRVWDSWNGSYYKQTMPAGNCAEAQAMSESERRIIKDWVQKGAMCGVPEDPNVQKTKAEKMESGRKLFATICAACHQPSGSGIPSRFPPLAASDFLNADKHRAARVVVNGMQGELMVNGQKYNTSMPKVPLGDQDVANVLTFVYSSFGNSGQEVTAEEVTAARSAKEETATARPNQPTPAQANNSFE